MNWEKGIFRAVLVLSIVVPVLVVLCCLIDGNVAYGDRILAYSAMFSVNIWIGFYAVRWIIKGFRKESQREGNEVKS